MPKRIPGRKYKVAVLQLLRTSTHFTHPFRMPVLILAALAILSACNGSGQTVQTNPSSPVSRSYNGPTETRLPSASADTSRPLSFHEIDQERKAITGGSEIPSVGQIRKLDEYDHSLEGKEISGWRGWVVETSPDKYMLDKDPGFHPTEFSVFITMDSSRIQAPRNKQFVLIDNGVMLDGVPRDQVEQLQVWSDIGTAEWQEVEFSATIDGVLPTAGLALILTNGRIKPLP